MSKIDEIKLELDDVCSNGEIGFGLCKAIKDAIERLRPYVELGELIARDTTTPEGKYLFFNNPAFEKCCIAVKDSKFGLLIHQIREQEG